MEELKLARIDGKTFDEIQEDVVRITNYFTNLWYDNYPVLKSHNYDKEQIIFDVYNGIYNRKVPNEYSNLEKHFIKASKSSFSMKYISNVIKRTVMLTLKCRARDISKKPILDSLDREIEQGSEKSTTLSDIISDKSESIESLIEIKSILESIPNKLYKDYYVISPFGEKKKLSTKKVLDWVIAGYKISEMQEKVFCKDKTNIKYRAMSEIKKETICLARKIFYED